MAEPTLLPLPPVDTDAIGTDASDDAAVGDLRDRRDRILTGALAGASVLGGFACATSVFLSVRVGLWGIAVLDIGVYGLLLGATFARRLPYAVRASALLVALGSVGIGVLAAVGAYGVGLAWVIAVPILAAILFDRRAFWITLGITAAAMLVAAGTSRGPTADVLWWLMAGASALFLTLVVGLSAAEAMAGLYAALVAMRREQSALERANAELRQEMARRELAERKLVLTQRMEAVGQMAGSIAHDFNNVLTVIQLEAMLASDNVGEIGRSDARGHLDAIHEACRRASELSSKLLQFSRNTAAERTSVGVDDEVQALRPLLERLVGERVTIVVRLGAGRARILIEKSQLEQILTNLAANARDAMPKGGTLELRTLAVDGERPLIRIDVRDTGSGMDADTRARVFEPFYTTKATGTGLGLTTVYAIASALGGAVELASEPGHGTAVTVWIPQDRASSTPVPAGATFALPPDPLPIGCRVVVVDDQLGVRNTIAEGLRQMGCAVWLAGTGSEALSVIDAMSRPPDLVLTDVVMPGMLGVDLCEQLLRRYPGVGLVAMTGTIAETADTGRLAAIGVRVLHKPFTPEDLLRVAASALRGRALA